jgi:hypothetical protein
MRRQAIGLAACVALSIPVMSGTTLAGGKKLGPTPAHFKANADFRFKANADFRPKSAFGGPGGFPLPIGHEPKSPHHFPRVPRHGLLPHFPVTTFWYTPTGLYAPPADPPSSVVSPPPVVNVSQTVYVSPPAAPWPPATVTAVSPPAPAPPSVVEYPTGRYELRGDGLGTAYTWVWIPNPPAAPPATPPTREDPPAASASSEGRGQTYRWTDEAGTTFWTNRLEKVPERHRSRAQGSVAPSE